MLDASLPPSMCSSNIRSDLCQRLALILLLSVLTGANAAVLSWSGAGSSANWSDIGNWGFAGTPTNGDTLIFSAAQPRLINSNNIASLTLNQIRFVGASGGYSISGNAFTLTNSIEATNTAGINAITNNITLSSPGDFVVNVATGAKFVFGGTLSGSAGLLKIGGGTNQLAGGFSNTYAGTTTITNGLLELFKTGIQAAAVPHDLVIGNGLTACTVRHLAGAEIADIGNVTVNRLSTWDLNISSETISNLTLSGGTVSNTGFGILTLTGDITALPTVSTATISASLFLKGATRTISVGSGSASPDLLISANISGTAGAGINKTGSGQMTLSGTNTYSGPTIVSGFVILANDSALGANGSSTNGTTVNANAILLVQGVRISNEFLTLSSGSDFRSSTTASWTGPITLNGDVFINVFGGTFTNSGAITGTGGITKGQTGTLIYSGSTINTYSGDTVVNTGILQLSKTVATAAIVNGALIIGDDIGGTDADIVRETLANQINSAVPITINSSGLLDLNDFNDAIGALTFSGGHLTTGTGTATLTGNVTANPNTNNLARIDGKVSVAATRTYNVGAGIWSPDLRVAAAVSGAGGITKTGAGEMSLTSSNSYTGLTTVGAGFLRLEDSFALGSTNTGSVVSNGATLSLLFDTHVGLEPLTLNGSGALSSFGALYSAFGSNSWAGAISLGADSTIGVATNEYLNLPGPIGGTGDLTKIGPGTLIYSGGVANTYSGSTFANEGTLSLNKTVTDGAIPHDLFVGDGVGPSLSDVVRINGNPQIATVSAVTIASSGLLDLNEVSEGIGTLSGSGRVDMGSLGTGGLIINGSGSATYTGLIIGTGGDLTKNGAGAFTLTGNNTYSGKTTVAAGALIVNGSQPQSPIVISSVGTLGGSGVVGNVTNTSGGVVAPGASPAILTTSNVIFSGASSDFTIELNGTTPDTGYDQVSARGAVSLGGATLNVTTAFGANDAPVEGTQFTIINNDGADAITGTFNGLASGAVLTAGNLKFQIRYTGGTGNDVVLTVTNTALGFVSSAISTGNGDGIVQPNECNLLNVVITNVSGSQVTNISATLLSATPGVTVVQASSAYPNLNASGRGTNSTPFQLSIAPSFVCGKNIDLTLVVATANQGTFGVPLVLNSGAAGASSSFSNLGVKLIPDGGSTNSSVSVSSISAPIAKVTVSLNINHGSDADLDLFLQGPDGTLVELSTDNGGSGNNYGNSCAQRTTFDDAAGTEITSGAPSFFGTFKPEGNLSDFRGKSGADVNGTWTLLITDDTANAVSGELDCWTLNIFQATCVPGGGICEFCPAATLSGALGTNSLQQTARLNRNGFVSACGVPKTCPGPLGSGTRSYDAYTFKNGPSNACITVTLTAPLSDLFSAAYTNSLDPSNLCLNYLADPGGSTLSLLAPTTYSFNVRSNATFVVTVNEVNPGSGGSYSLQVSGGECRPALNITALAGNKIQLDWTTASAGYGLESTNSVIAAPPWTPVISTPSAVNGRFVVTNNITTSNRFFRLRKP